MRRFYSYLNYFIFAAAFFVSHNLNATTEEAVTLGHGISAEDISNRPLLLLLVFGALAIAPFVGMMVTSFVKIAVVLSITRQAIGLQQVPPSTVITGLAILLSIYVMQPVATEVYARSEKYFQQSNTSFLDKSNVDLLMNAVHVSEEPIKRFLQSNASRQNINMFFNLGKKMRSSKEQMAITANDYMVLVPAFVVSELTEAFQIGFIIFLPFLIVDMVIANILMALGMQMLSPTTISLPFKILLFVLVDGWHLITKGLVLGYQF